MRGPRAGYRPTQDRVREAVFSSIAAHVPGCRFLDLFAGVGSVGLEAASRGAREVCWVERHPARYASLRQAVEGFREEADDVVMRTVRGESLRFLERDGSGPFDLIYADPPYDRENRQDWLGNLLRGVGAGSMLAPDGVFIMEAPTDGVAEDVPDGWHCARDARYGSAWIRYLRAVREGEAPATIGED